MLTPLVRQVLTVLDYAGAEGLVTAESEMIQPGRLQVWQQVREKFGLDAAYFFGTVPVVYFKGMQTASEHELWNLHRQLWNHNRAPLLVVVLPEEVRIYNCFSPPTPSGKPSAGTLLGKIQIVVDIAEGNSELAPFRRQEVESGRLSKERQSQFRRELRVDRRLLQNLQSVRSALLGTGLQESIVNNLIGRSIFIRYLEDRGVLRPALLHQFADSTSYNELLALSNKESYRLFRSLAEKFNGDIFPILSEEEDTVQGSHLSLLSSFLSGTEIQSGQMYFWAYDFAYIPTELISSIYEEFLHGERRAIGAYFTPPEVVDFVLNEVLPWDCETKRIKVLDPACGSGIFLVEAYRRLVERERRAKGGAVLPFEDLRDILSECIYGVDKNEEAIRVAAFSCYLALLDYLEPKWIWTKVRFPSLRGSNLFPCDFFDAEAPFNSYRYNVIVGNPPWQSKLSGLASAYIRDSRRPVGDQQLAQAFLWRVPDLLASDGKACLLSPSKGVLFNKSAPNLLFRKQFLETFDTYGVVDFSPFRRSLFQNARAPMVAVFLRPDPGRSTGDITYCTPRPSPLADSLAGVVVSSDEIKQLSRRKAALHPDIWKILLWGSPRDFALVETLRHRFPSLGQFEKELHWAVHRGAQIYGPGGRPHHAPELASMTFIPATELRPFQILSWSDERIDATDFYRTGDPRTYRAPHVLVRKDLYRGGVIAAAFLGHDAVFKDSVIGIAGAPEDAAKLKTLCAYLNSSLARFYYFLTGTGWGVERDEIQKEDHLSFPCAIPLSGGDSNLEQVSAFVDAVQGSYSGSAWRAELDDLVFAAYGLTQAERVLVLDIVNTTIDQFYRRSRSHAFEIPSLKDLITYSEAYAKVFHANLRSSVFQVIPIVYEGTAPYCAVSFQFVKRDGRSSAVNVLVQPGLDELLTRLDRSIIERYSQNLYFRRDVKIYDPDAVHVIKPSERRYWTESAAYNDADETLGQLLRTLESI